MPMMWQGEHLWNVSVHQRVHFYSLVSYQYVLCLQVVDHYADSKIDLRLYMVMLALPLVFLNMIRNLKWLAPFSMIANLLMATGVGITFYYIFIDLPSVDDRPQFVSLHQLPLFFGTAIFALEGIGVVRKMYIYVQEIRSLH